MQQVFAYLSPPLEEVDFFREVTKSNPNFTAIFVHAIVEVIQRSIDIARRHGSNPYNAVDDMCGVVLSDICITTLADYLHAHPEHEDTVMGFLDHYARYLMDHALTPLGLFQSCRYGLLLGVAFSSYRGGGVILSLLYN